MGASPTSTPEAPPPRWLGIDLVHNRWLFPASGLLATAMGGAAYAYSVFILPLGDPVEGIGLRREEATLAFGLAIFLVSLAVFGGGVLVDRYGPRGVLALGGLLATGGLLLASQAEASWQFIATFGVLFGGGAGLSYTACTIALAARWYPDADKRGTAIGWSIVGFGAGGVLAGPLWTAGIEAFGWRETLVITGVLYALVFALLLTIVRFPPLTWAFTQDRGWHPAPAGAAPAPRGPAPMFELNEWDMRLAEAVRNRYLYIAGGIFMLGMFGGLLAIGQLAVYAEEHLEVSAALGGLLVAVFAVGNGTGRPTAGWLSARIGVRRSLVLAYAMMAAGLATLALSDAPAIAFPAAVLTGLAFGGSLALTPVVTALLFGTSFLARIYGLVFVIGFGIGGLSGGFTGSRLVVAFDGSYTIAFLLAATVAGLAALAARLLLPSQGQERQHTPRTKSAFDDFVAALASLKPADPPAQVAPASPEDAARPS
jgi:MFS family permease